MADITDIEAVAFCNERIRTAANQLATLYYECDYLRDLKVADADTATTISLRGDQIRVAADLMLETTQVLPIIENIWFNVASLNTTITNSADDDVIDGSPADGRPPITGQDVHNLVSRVMDVDKWLADASFGGAGAGGSRSAMLNTIVVCGGSGNDPLQVSQVNTFIDNRCGEWVTEYEATSNAKLTQLLAVAPSPRNPV